MSSCLSQTCIARFGELLILGSVAVFFLGGRTLKKQNTEQQTHKSLPETPPGGYLFRLQDVEKQRERKEKLRQKRQKDERRKNLERPRKTHKFVGFFLGMFPSFLL